MSALLVLLLMWAQAGPGAAGSAPPQDAASASPEVPRQSPSPSAVAVPVQAPGSAGQPSAVGGEDNPGQPSDEAAARAARAQAEARAAAAQAQTWQFWVLIFGEPGDTVLTWWGSLLSWVKVVALLSLLGWVGSWILSALRDRPPARVLIGGARPTDLIALLAVIVGVLCIFARVAQLNGRLADFAVGGTPVAILVGIGAILLLVGWVETVAWSALRRSGSRADRTVWIGMHAAVVLGLVFGLTLPRGLSQALSGYPFPFSGLAVGTRVGFTFMGYVVLLRVLQQTLAEVSAVHPRRLYAIGLHSWIESFRKTRIPWAVLAIFVVILAFTHWFLVPPDAQRQAELSRLYVGALMLICSLLLTLMVAILTPITLPNDIRFQTIYTVVTKPVRRLEVIWGRILGFMAVVTALIVLLGGISLFYLYRNVGSRVSALELQAAEARRSGQTSKADQLEGQLDQLRTRMSARVPVYGSLTFIDSVGQPQLKGIDVGQELEIRSHVEGATQAKAIWSFGSNLPHPIDRLFPDPRRQPMPTVNVPVPLDRLLKAGTIEYIGNEVYTLRDRVTQLEQQKQAGKLSNETLQRLNRQIEEIKAQVERRTAEYEGKRKEAENLLARAAEAQKAGQSEQAASLRAQASQLSSPPVQVQMTFTVYRTTKGRVGDPVYASIKAINPFNPAANFSDTFSIKEYYTNKWQFPAQVLMGSRGYLNLEVQCLSPTQYLGIAESDLFLVTNQGSFWVNYLKGMLGIWLQAMVLTAIGVWAGTFLSWPVALLTTIFFFVSGEVLFPVLKDLAANAVIGGGPFESLIRLVSHENQMSQLDSTLGVVLARSFDSIVVPLMSRLIYIIPNFSALDVSNTVADGFAVSWATIGRGLLLALAYALPFSIAGYFILKNREVAA